MKRLFLTMMAISLPVVALAQQPEGRPATEGIVVAQAANVAASATSATQAPPPPSGPRRRPSMVGYIDDSSISNKFRVRFDSGTDIKGADRAEFFYAKCGCYRDLPPTNAAYDPVTGKLNDGVNLLSDGTVSTDRHLPKNAGFGVANAYQTPRSVQGQIRFSF